MTPHDMTQPWQITSLAPFGHCSYCGAGYPDGAAPWPRVCGTCGETIWRNPLPVALLVVPVRHADGGPDGLVVVRRDIEPARGELCLPGGYIELGETWTEAAARELREEAALIAAPSDVELYDVISTPRHVLIVGIVPPRDAAGLPPSSATDESTEWLVIREPIAVPFPAHSATIARFFAAP
jgi:ADP-ribose pyrophosphatase YjhB (NUDIX family)